jgi:[histone H3]-lysine36 N-trimethyltransferase
LTHLIAEKEKKSTSYKEGKLDSLSEEKITKIKKFAKEYIAKILRKLEKAGHRPKPSIASGSSSSMPTTSPVMETPNSAGGVDTATACISVEDIMDDADQDIDNVEDDEMGDGDQSTTAIGPISPEDSGFVKDQVMVDASSPRLDFETTDPRIRLLNGVKGIPRQNGAVKVNGIHGQIKEPPSKGDGDAIPVDPPLIG